MPEALEAAVSAWVENPFDLAAAPRAAAAARLDKLQLGRELSRSLDAGRLEFAKELLLAVAHARAAAGQSPAALIAAAEVPHTVLSALPRKLSEYTQVAAAAGRAYRSLNQIIGTTATMNDLRRDVWSTCFGASLRRAMDLRNVIRDHDVLILGETGTGKEAIARAIQEGTPGDASGAPAPHAAMNAAALPDTLVESELFGHAKGAFTGAAEARAGRLRGASGGTFFLDEVGDLPTTTQVKLLRVIETNEVYPLGSDTSYQVDVRYVAATHKNIEELVDRREFRQDLFERLAGKILRLPPLRERRTDVFAIADAFIDGYVTGEWVDDLRQVAHDWLGSPSARGYGWPGNVRELQNVLRDLMLGIVPTLKRGQLATSEIATPHLPRSISDGAATLAELNRWYVEFVLAQADGNISAAARILGVDRGTLQRRRLSP